MRFVEVLSLFNDELVILVQGMVMPGKIRKIRLQEACHLGRLANVMAVPVLGGECIAGRKVLLGFNDQQLFANFVPDMNGELLARLELDFVGPDFLGLWLSWAKASRVRIRH